jgi:outer membrane protein assembly factor BamB
MSGRGNGWLGNLARVAPLLVLLAGGAVRADDWPQWLGPRRDGVWRETGILEKFPSAGLPVRWRVPVAAGYSGPAVADGRVYVLDRVLAKGARNPAEGFPMSKREGIPGTERVLCLGEADGKLLWKHEYDCPYFVSYPLGPRTTPLVKDRRVYTLGTEGNLLSLDAEKGKVLWAHDLKKEYGVKAPLWGFSAHPLLDGQKLICMVGGDGSTVVAFDKDTGKEIWRALSAKQLGYCPPMIYEVGGKRQLIVWHGEALNGLDPETGKVYWTEPVATYMAMAIATPRSFGDGVFITAYPNTALLCRPAAGRPAPEVVWRGDKKTGLFSVFGTPFVEGGYIYGSTLNGRLACVKADTGERLWETLAPNGGKAAPSGDLFITKNGDRFFLANEKGDLILARLSPKGYDEIGRTHLLEATATAFGRDVVWSPPAFADRCIFTRNDKEIICASLAAQAPNGGAAK